MVYLPFVYSLIEVSTPSSVPISHGPSLPPPPELCSRLYLVCQMIKHGNRVIASIWYYYFFLNIFNVFLPILIVLHGHAVNWSMIA